MKILWQKNLTIQPDSDIKSYSEGGRSKNPLATNYSPSVKPQQGTGAEKPQGKELSLVLVLTAQSLFPLEGTGRIVW